MQIEKIENYVISKLLGCLSEELTEEVSRRGIEVLVHGQ
jgi:hypothetical protein